MFILKDTPNYKNYLKPLTSLTPDRNTHAYRVITNEPTLLRFNKLEDGRKELMLGGGPKLTEGDVIPKTTVRVVAIGKGGLGYIIFTEDDLPCNSSDSASATE